MMDVGSDGVPGCVKMHARRSHRPRKIGVKAMSTLFDILKKDRNGTFQWLETVNDIEIAKARVLKLSSGSLDEFVIFRGNDLQVVATSQAMQTDTQVLGDLLEV
jgi:hypothetical protein